MNKKSVFARVLALMLALMLAFCAVAMAEETDTTEPDATVEATETPEGDAAPEDDAAPEGDAALEGDAVLEDGETEDPAGTGDVLTAEEEEALVYSEEKVSINKDDLALTAGLDKNWLNILLAGSDSRSESSYGRTDAIIILSVNKSTGAVKMTSVMRDTWVDMYNHTPQKINAANVFGGPTLLMRTLNEKFGLNIEDYVLINMQAIEGVIDLLGGVEMDITEKEMLALRRSYNIDDSAYVEPLESFGENTHLTGEQALAYARLRKSDDDYQRSARQRNVLIAIARKAREASSTELIQLISECMNYVETDLTMTDVVQLALIAMQVDLESIEQFRIPVDGTYSSGIMPENKLWTIRPDFEKNTALLHEFIYGVDAN